MWADQQATWLEDISTNESEFLRRSFPNQLQYAFVCVKIKNFQSQRRRMHHTAPLLRQGAFWPLIGQRTLPQQTTHLYRVSGALALERGISA